MSTRLTKRGVPMRDSQSLKLVLAASAIAEQITRHLNERLQAKGYAVTPSLLTFLSVLDCDAANYGSEIARVMGVSRQLVARYVRDAVNAGFLAQVIGVGKQKQILFTAQGEQLMSDARELLAQLDEQFYEVIGRDSIEHTLTHLAAIHTAMTQTKSDI